LIPLFLQIENEFGPLEWDQGEPAKAYVSWAANMAVQLNTGVPWIMCKEDDAPDPIVCTVLLSLIMHLGQHFFNVLGSDLETIAQERKLIMCWMICYCFFSLCSLNKNLL
jgi:hypothetical protein